MAEIGAFDKNVKIEYCLREKEILSIKEGGLEYQKEEERAEVIRFGCDERIVCMSFILVHPLYFMKLSQQISAHFRFLILNCYLLSLLILGHMSHFDMSVDRS